MALRNPGFKAILAKKSKRIELGDQRVDQSGSSLHGQRFDPAQLHQVRDDQRD
jgi:hypothetical protein